LDVPPEIAGFDWRIYKRKVFMLSRHWLIWMLALGLFCGVVVRRAAMAEDEAAEATEEDAEASADDKEPADPFAVPDGTNDELMEFMMKVQGIPPEGRSREEMIDNFQKKTQAMLQAADKILSQDPDDNTRVEASKIKLASFERMLQLGNADAQASLQKFAAELAAGKDEQLVDLGRSALANLRIRKIASGDLEGADKLIQEFVEKLEKDPNDQTNMRSAMGLAQALEYSGDAGAPLAVKAYQQFGKIMATSTDPQIAGYGKKLEGVVRRLQLLGNSMELSGTLLDGTTFDPESLKGKVVLVDFWATWCGPCIAELPNLLSNYEQYHDKGFEVIGISLDNDREALEKFMEERKLPWPILYEDSDGSRGWSNPLVEKYGIMGIPTVILMNAEGKVVSLNARGGKLGQLLAELLGEDKS
jgi:thiol-disulfide isomerase/thioredoxin